MHNFHSQGDTITWECWTTVLCYRQYASCFSCILHLVSFSQGLRLRQSDMVEDQLAGSSRTLSKMAKVLRGICKTVMKNYRRRQGQVVGGGQEFAVIDESCFRHKRKVRGKVSHTQTRMVLKLLYIYINKPSPYPHEHPNFPLT